MEQDSKGQAKGALMKSLDNALTLLEQFTPEAPAFGITELATRLGLNKATVFNMLKTLEAHSLVKQLSDTKKCTLGHGIIVLAGTKLAQSELSHVARPHLARLSHETNETTHLAILHRNELLYLEKIESSQPVRVAARIGGRAPLHCTANGKVLLAFQPNEVIEEALRALTVAIAQQDQHAGQIGEKREKADGAHHLGARQPGAEHQPERRAENPEPHEKKRDPLGQRHLGAQRQRAADHPEAEAIGHRIGEEIQRIAARSACDPASAPAVISTPNMAAFSAITA